MNRIVTFGPSGSRARLEKPHSKECFRNRPPFDPTHWLALSTSHVIAWKDRNGQNRGRNIAWIRLGCSSYGCQARVIVPAQDLTRFIDRSIWRGA